MKGEGFRDEDGGQLSAVRVLPAEEFVDGEPREVEVRPQIMKIEGELLTQAFGLRTTPPISQTASPRMSMIPGFVLL